MTPIYDMIPEHAKQECGYFTPKCAHRIFDVYTDYVHKGSWSRQKQINDETLVLYYPGSFGSFHEGHLSVIRKSIEYARRHTDNYIVVVSPANSDYLVSKYGAHSVRSSNKKRFERIEQWLFHMCGDMWIDMNPMLNNPCDYNVDTLVEQFLVQEAGLTIKQMKTAPMIVGGKDRNFEHLNKYQGYLEGLYFEDTTGESTSKHENKFIPRKHLILRVHDFKQAKLFEQYFGTQYESITPQLISTEKYVAQEYARMNGIKYTNCKDYAEFLRYIPLSRNWVNPFQHSGFVGDTYNLERLKGETFLDSDVFSGSTQDHLLRNYDIDCVALVDLSKRDDVELLDIDDFYTWSYPQVDISSRCSMSAFTAEDHLNFKNFVEDLKELNRV